MGKAPKYVTPKEASEYLCGVPTATLAVWRSTGSVRLPYVKLGRRILYSVDALDAFMSERQQTHTGEKVAC